MTREKNGGWTWGEAQGVKLRSLSLGAGIQSTTLLLMALSGEIVPRPDVVIFADTGDEPEGVMRHLDWLEGETKRKTNGQIPIIIVGKGERLSDNLYRRVEGDEKRFVSAPFFTSNGGMVRRQCTREYKINPITQKLRDLLGYSKSQRIPQGSVESWIGISTDEVVRAAPSRARWIINRFPLLEHRMSRGDCIEWLKRHGYPVPQKSACFFCPYRSNAEWRHMRDNDSATWRKAVSFDHAIRKSSAMRNSEYLHRSLNPLDQVDLSTKEDKGQHTLFCDGGCGL